MAQKKVVKKKGYQAIMKSKVSKKKRWQAALDRNVEVMEEVQKTHHSSIQNRAKMLKAKQRPAKRVAKKVATKAARKKKVNR